MENLGLFQFIVLFSLYLLPTWISAGRKHHNSTPIFIVNLLLGWTAVVWIVCLAWSFSHVKT
ncbi:superinfection immunity protein [Vibrio parahaemolyticus]|uniref:superinfection immunity protein n=1 Tax=Vibrio parahaemolyticus TaxID=670 RepID=UPI00111FE910|nr:superinfection immunity protein [Vibrio parahaemolyticus]HAS6051638.1 superinfection immunity protein [Vibrio vulnificus]HCG6476967.1 superinfection immunity protein [Vibrio parahaemolyticus]HDY7995111.1 superinfection immunity protein [Vibrio vulnificus]